MNNSNKDNIAIPAILKNISLRTIIILVGSLLIFAVFANIFKNIYSELLWFGQLNYQDIYLTILKTKIYLFIIGFLLSITTLSISSFIAFKYSWNGFESELPEPFNMLGPKLYKYLLIIAVFGVSVIIGFTNAVNWELFLRFFNSSPFEVSDPIFNRDLSFYIFNYPVYTYIQKGLLVILVLCTIFPLFIIFINSAFAGRQFSESKILRKQIPILFAIIFLLFSLGVLFSRWGVLFSTQGVVFGAGYTDVNVKIIAYLIMAVLGFLISVIIPFSIKYSPRNFAYIPVISWGVLYILLVLLWPTLTQRFSVTPNEYVKEKNYIANNIEFTRKAYGLDKIEESYFPANSKIPSSIFTDHSETLNNIRLWDHKPLKDVYTQTQLIRPYYDFKDVDVDRYIIDGKYRQVMLATREVAPEKLDEDKQTWVNVFLQYTHGYGLAMSPVNSFDSQGKPYFYAKDIPSDGVIKVHSLNGKLQENLSVENPRIYYGESITPYVIVNTKTMEVDYQEKGKEGKEGVLKRHNYKGKGGVILSNFLIKFVYAWKFSDINLMISDEIHPDSKIQYHRNIQDRVNKLVPFLELDSDPYIVLHDGKLKWIQDAYTFSNNFPYSEPFEGKFNYIRNSVKAVIDAYDGTVKFYVADNSDPLIDTYSKIFPNIFRPLSEMPPDLREHIRYPIDIFKIQSNKYLEYHMQDSQIFYNNEDLWNIPQEKFGQSAELQKVEPYYLIMNLPGNKDTEFVLLSPFTPNQRKNLIGWLAGRSDGDHYGKLIAYNFPKDLTIYGTEQIEARMDNDPMISEWFTLRCQEGSFCIRGNLLVIPIGDTLLYAEPIYMQAEGVDLPELKKVVLASADHVIMADSVEEGVKALIEKQSNEIQIGDIKVIPEVDDSAKGISDVLSKKIENLLEDIKLILEELNQVK